VKVLFRVAAGPRQGYGHLVRATALARALGTRPIVALRGGDGAARVARRLGCRVVTGELSMLRRIRPQVLVIDDPSGAHATAWCRAAQRVGIPVASVHDLGIGRCGADLTIDGSITYGDYHGRDQLLGPRYSILTAGVAPDPARRRSGVLIALGGGAHQTAVQQLSREIARTTGAPIRIATGFTRVGPAGLARELSRCAVALVAGGVTLYEACALGTPTVALAVVRAQRPTIAGFAGLGAVVDAGLLNGTPSIRRAARAVGRLLDAAEVRRTLGARARSRVDGRGALRVAAAIRGIAA